MWPSLFFVLCQALFPSCLYFLEFAMSPNNTEVHIYAMKGGKWEVESVLSEHGSRVTGMDWAPKSDCLVTCSAVSGHGLSIV